MYKKAKILLKREVAYGFLVVAILALGALIVFSVLTGPKQDKAEIYEKPRPVATAAAGVVRSFPSPSPLASPSATPEAAPVYTGYCLNVPVIFYHHIQPLAEAKAQGHGGLTVDSGIFDSQMAYLVSRGYKTISADQLAAALAGHLGVPAKSIVVSMDDGYDDIHKYAYPIIQKYGIVASLAIPTGLMNNPGYMNWDQLREMTGSGKVFVYNHTWSHANLAGGTRDKAQYEVSTAKKQLAENLGKSSSVLFYPYGATNDTVTQVLAQNGYNAAFTTLPGTVQCDTFMMSLHRTRIGNSPLASYGL